MKELVLNYKEIKYDLEGDQLVKEEEEEDGREEYTPYGDLKAWDIISGSEYNTPAIVVPKNVIKYENRCEEKLKDYVYLHYFRGYFFQCSSTYTGFYDNGRNSQDRNNLEKSIRTNSEIYLNKEHKVEATILLTNIVNEMVNCIANYSPEVAVYCKEVFEGSKDYEEVPELLKAFLNIAIYTLKREHIIGYNSTLTYLRYFNSKELFKEDNVEKFHKDYRELVAAKRSSKEFGSVVVEVDKYTMKVYTDKRPPKEAKTEYLFLPIAQLDISYSEEDVEGLSGKLVHIGYFNSDSYKLLKDKTAVKALCYYSLLNSELEERISNAMLSEEKQKEIVDAYAIETLDREVSNNLIKIKNLIEIRRDSSEDHYYKINLENIQKIFAGFVTNGESPYSVNQLVRILSLDILCLHDTDYLTCKDPVSGKYKSRERLNLH